MKFVTSFKIGQVVSNNDIVSEFKVGNMMAGNTNYPYNCHPKNMLAVQKQRKIQNDYCNDVMIRGEYPFFAKKL